MKKITLLLAFTVTALGAGAWYIYNPRHPVLSERNLALAPFIRGTMRDVVSATGILETRDLVMVGSEIPGTVQTLNARVNDTVHEGMVLATLDDRKIRLKVEQAENDLRSALAAQAQAQSAKEAAEIGYRTQEDLAKAGGFRTDLDRAKTQAKAAAAGLLMAEAKVKTAQTLVTEANLALDMANLRVPMTSTHGAKRSYLILERKAHLGQAVGPQAGPLFVLAGDLQHMEIHAQVAEGDINKVRKGLAAVFTLTGFSEEEIEFRGIVREIRPLANSVKGAVYYDTVVEVANQKDPVSGEWRLRPGMTASVDIIRGEHKDVWKIPSQALNFKLDEPYQTPAIKERLVEWRKRPDAEQWSTMWTWDAGKQSVWPLFVRILGTNPQGEVGLKDSDGNEVLEWEPGREPTATQAPPRVIINAPPAKAPGVFDQPANLKVS